jgi:hypothetical protein
MKTLQRGACAARGLLGTGVAQSIRLAAIAAAEQVWTVGVLWSTKPKADRGTADSRRGANATENRAWVRARARIDRDVGGIGRFTRVSIVADGGPVQVGRWAIGVRRAAHSRDSCPVASAVSDRGVAHGLERGKRHAPPHGQTVAGREEAGLPCAAVGTRRARGRGFARVPVARAAIAGALRRRGCAQQPPIACCSLRYGCHLASAPGQEDQRASDRGRRPPHASTVAPLAKSGAMPRGRAPGADERWRRYREAREWWR